MSGRLLFTAGSVIVITTGCASIEPDTKINEAAGFVEQRLGQKPAWTAPWEDQPPAWDGRTTLKLQDAVAAALRNNRDLRADLEMIGQANADLVQAGLLTNRKRPDGGEGYVLTPEGREVARQLAMTDEASMAELPDGLLGPEDRGIGAK